MEVMLALVLWHWTLIIGTPLLLLVLMFLQGLFFYEILPWLRRNWPDCPTCNGSGEILEKLRCTGHDPKQSCGTCGDTGYYEGIGKCDDCLGFGKIKPETQPVS